jgi:glycosyltransferase involved in cell wall biosynthesis
VVKSLTIVIPCFNEQESIPEVMPRLLDSLESLQKKEHLGQYEVIVVNDHSTDQSRQLLEKYKQIVIIDNQSHYRGYGRSLKQGFLESRGEWVGFLDMDNSYRPEDLDLFIRAILEGRSDFIMGTRSFSEKGMSFVRGLGNWVYMASARLLYGSYLKDVCSGYRFFHRRLIDQITEIPEDGLDFSIHLSLKMLSQNIPIQQIPITYDERLGTSKLSVVADGIAFFRVLLSLRVRQWRALKHSRVQ